MDAEGQHMRNKTGHALSSASSHGWILMIKYPKTLPVLPNLDVGAVPAQLAPQNLQGVGEGMLRNHLHGHPPRTCSPTYARGVYLPRAGRQVLHSVPPPHAAIADASFQQPGGGGCWQCIQPKNKKTDCPLQL